MTKNDEFIKVMTTYHKEIAELSKKYKARLMMLDPQGYSEATKELYSKSLTMADTMIKQSEMIVGASFLLRLSNLFENEEDED